MLFQLLFFFVLASVYVLTEAMEDPHAFLAAAQCVSSVKHDVSDLGGRLDTTLRARVSTLAVQVHAAVSCCLAHSSHSQGQGRYCPI